MTCDFCIRNLVPRTREQLRIRERNIRDHPGVLLSPCPACGETDWALCRDFIAEEVRGSERGSNRLFTSLVVCGLLLSLAMIAWALYLYWSEP